MTITVGAHGRVGVMVQITRWVNVTVRVKVGIIKWVNVTIRVTYEG